MRNVCRYAALAAACTWQCLWRVASYNAQSTTGGRLTIYNAQLVAGKRTMYIACDRLSLRYGLPLYIVPIEYETFLELDHILTTATENETEPETTLDPDSVITDATDGVDKKKPFVDKVVYDIFDADIRMDLDAYVVISVGTIMIQGKGERMTMSLKRLDLEHVPVSRQECDEPVSMQECDEPVSMMNRVTAPFVRKYSM
ncbi:unnamed protein product [Polarella glacialis]|uniref:Uncharacterized protein n=1 Tax=Polarella glacialis TaxID=89957 RepID=A0A813K685_POLGL|nr:unnamed protein product [Polarella glacialis]